MILTQFAPGYASMYLKLQLNIDMDQKTIALLMDDFYYCVGLLVVDLIAFGVGMTIGLLLYIW
jgi:hypothetical protein